MIKTNYHTHTTYCDGVNTAEEMIQSAIEKRFSILGFSSHSIYPFAKRKRIQKKSVRLQKNTAVKLPFSADLRQTTFPDFQFRLKNSTKNSDRTI